MSQPPTKILLIEDDREDYLITRDLLEDIDAWEAQLDWASTYDEGLAAICRAEHDVYLIDYRLGARDGLELLQQAIETGCTAPLILVTGYRDHETDLAAMKAGAADFLTKGRIDTDLLERSIRYALERAQARDQLADANQQLQRKNQTLSELTETAHRFVDNVAHEFRTPLTVIKEFSTIIGDGIGGPVTDEQTEFLRYITSATRDLALMVDDFLDSSKLKAGSLRISRQPHSIKSIFESVRPMLAIRAAERKSAVTEAIDPGVGAVFADLEKAGRVIVNLAVNAIKFSPEGSEVELWAKPLDDGGVRIGITDRGPGLSEHDVAVIFERFKQVGDVQRASTKGFGLGLNIAKELIWLNLGTVDVRSTVGSGSTFSFTLPANNPCVVLASYLDRLGELDDPPKNLIACTVIAPAGGFDSDLLHDFLATSCRPLDLAIAGQPAGSILIVGPDNTPDGIVNRLNEAHVAALETRPEQTPQAISAESLGTFGYPSRRAELEQLVATHVREPQICA